MEPETGLFVPLGRFSDTRGLGFPAHRVAPDREVPWRSPRELGRNPFAAGAISPPIIDSDDDKRHGSGRQPRNAPNSLFPKRDRWREPASGNRLARVDNVSSAHQGSATQPTIRSPSSNTQPIPKISVTRRFPRRKFQDRGISRSAGSTWRGRGSNSRTVGPRRAMKWVVADDNRCTSVSLHRSRGKGTDIFAGWGFRRPLLPPLAPGSNQDTDPK
jgi:hypothetical protein